ncbi:MAG: TIGR03905 family TSCPD domain-containing protein [Succinivibrionaceae bacterium]|nr:TIGR03905 family TSCPD domain-containing protein [Succinivibrionaceae bacterium]
MHHYTTHGTCSKSIDLEISDGRIVSATFNGGCPGNTQGISRLVAGMEVERAIALLEGIRCGRKATSCPDQLAAALKNWRDSQKNSLNSAQTVDRMDLIP